MDISLVTKLFISILNFSLLLCVVEVKHLGVRWVCVLLAMLDVLLFLQFQIACFTLITFIAFLIYYKFFYSVNEKGSQKV